MIRTVKQNASLHVYARELAKAMDEAGIDMRKAIKVPIQPTEENVKETMIRPVMEAMWPGRQSTTRLSRIEISELYEVMNRFTAEKLGISVPWPSEDSEA